MKYYMFKEEYTLPDIDPIYIVGRTSEIKPIAKALYRAWKKGNTTLYPTFEGSPKFKNKMVYGICIYENDWHIVTSDAIMDMIVMGEVEEVKRWEFNL